MSKDNKKIPYSQETIDALRVKLDCNGDDDCAICTLLENPDDSDAGADIVQVLYESDLERRRESFDRYGWGESA
jgi:hypothetical protein